MQVMAGILKLNDNTEIFQLIAKDVTREKEAENKIQNLLKELEAANLKLEALSITDEMTKMYNFRHFITQLKIEHEKAARYGFPYTIIFCDVDNFKHYNDRNGHPAGDQVLRGVASVLKATLRVSDLVARYGGEEFVALCVNTESADGQRLAERIRLAIEKHPFEHAKEQPLGCVSISIGVASFPTDGQIADEILKAADQAVYLSKKNGRNRVTAF
jgi:diguanylate cyclase (GGDEF)-like protein